MNYRYILEKYRGRNTRYNCPQCGRKHTFTRYIDTENNNRYIADNVGKCNRLDKCGYHYTPKQYYTDHWWIKREGESGVVANENIGKCNNSNSNTPSQSVVANRNIGFCNNSNSNKSPDTLSERYVEGAYARSSSHLEWLRANYGDEAAERIRAMYRLGATRDGRVVFWQIDTEGRVRTGKVMAYDATTGRRLKTEGSCDWVHSILRRQGILDEGWELRQCLYGEHLLAERKEAVVAVVESYKTAHVGAIVMPEMVWTATDSLTGLTAERLRALTGRRVVLFPDEGKGYEQWSERIASIAAEVGFTYRVSSIMEGAVYSDVGADIADAALCEPNIWDSDPPF